MKNAMQLKAFIKKIANEKKISAQVVMQNYMLERLLERISLSKYQSQLILKGGFLIAAIVGLDTRATMDMDATIKGHSLTKQALKTIFDEILSIHIDDDIKFEISKIEDIRETDEYSGFRISLKAIYPPMAIPLKIDVTTGDKITPREIEYEFKMMFENRKLKVMAYNLETILAEKLETVITRGILNTRLRDYYDIYTLWTLQRDNIDNTILKQAIMSTCERRETLSKMQNWESEFEEISADETLKSYWKTYQNEFDYAKDIEFELICQVIRRILN